MTDTTVTVGPNTFRKLRGGWVAVQNEPRVTVSANELLDEIATLRAQLAGVRERIMQLPPARYELNPSEDILWDGAVMRADVLAALDGAQ